MGVVTALTSRVQFWGGDLCIYLGTFALFIYNWEDNKQVSSCVPPCLILHTLIDLMSLEDYGELVATWNIHQAAKKVKNSEQIKMVVLVCSSTGVYVCTLLRGLCVCVYVTMKKWMFSQLLILEKALTEMMRRCVLWSGYYVKSVAVGWFLHALYSLLPALQNSLGCISLGCKQLHRDSLV